MPKYSVVVVGKNEEKYILNLLNELNKLPNEVEIVFVFPKNDPTWKVIKTHMRREYKSGYDPGKGPGYARNLGRDLAEGEYLVLFDADCWMSYKDIMKLLKLIEKRDDVCYIYPVLEHLPKFFPKSMKIIADFIMCSIFWPIYILTNNILALPLTLTNVFACRKSEFARFSDYYPGEDFDFGYKLKKKTGKRFVVTFSLRSYTYDRRFCNFKFPFWLRVLSPLLALVFYIVHSTYFIVFKKPLPIFKYRFIR